MTSIKHIAAGLIGSRPCSRTSAMAHQTSEAGSFTVMRGHASVPPPAIGMTITPACRPGASGDSEALPQDPARRRLRPWRQPNDLLRPRGAPAGTATPAKTPPVGMLEMTWSA